VSPYENRCGSPSRARTASAAAPRRASTSCMLGAHEGWS
jgi:hypothetical protein